MKATAFAPGSIGNVGPGFDVLGLAIEGLGEGGDIPVDFSSDGGTGGRESGMVGRGVMTIPSEGLILLISVTAAA